MTIVGLARGLEILALFDSHHPEWTLKGLVERSGLHKSTVYRVVRTMEDKKFLGFDPDSGLYHLGPAMYRAAFLATAHSELARAAAPYLEKLAAQTGETATLAVESDGAVLIVKRVLTSNPFKPVFAVGEVHGYIGNSHGKIFLAYKSREERRRLLEAGVPRLTANTTTDLDAVEREAERVVNEGVAYDLEEESAGFCGVSAPVFGQGGELVASLSVVAPRERFGYAEQRRYAEAIKAQAASLSAVLAMGAKATP